jgi:hypothetical protein
LGGREGGWETANEGWKMGDGWETGKEDLGQTEER